MSDYFFALHTVPGSTVPTRGAIVIGLFAGRSNWNDVGLTGANSPFPIRGTGCLN